MSLQRNKIERQERDERVRAAAVRGRQTSHPEHRISSKHTPSPTHRTGFPHPHRAFSFSVTGARSRPPRLTMAQAENPELTELKSIIKSFVISGEGNAGIGRIAREYEDMEGCAIPFHKFGFSSLTEFLKSHLFRDEFFFGCNKDGFEVLKPKNDEKTAHIQDLVRNQKHKTARKKKPLSRFGVSRTGARAGAPGASFNFHAAGMARIGYSAYARKAATPSNYFNNNANRFQNRSTGFSMGKSQQTGASQQPAPAVRPLTAQQTNRQPQMQQRQQQTPNWTSPVKQAGSQPPPAAGRIVQKTSTPNVQNVSMSFASPGWEADQKPAAAGRTVVTNFANKAPAAKTLVKVVNSPATSFKAPAIRSVGRGTSAASRPQKDAPPGIPILTLDEQDRHHWLRMKCLQTFYFVRKEASVSGISVTDFSHKFFTTHKSFLTRHCESLQFSSITGFLQESFASPPSSPAASSASDMTASNGSTSSDKLLKIVANSSLMFNRKRFKDLIQQLVNNVVTASLSDKKDADEGQIPEEFLPPVLLQKLKQSLGPKYSISGELSGLLVKWFFNRFLPSSQSGACVKVPDDKTSFCEELKFFAQEVDKLTFTYSIFPVASDVANFIRKIDDGELSDPEHLQTGDASSMKWVPVSICSALSPALMYVTRVKEQDAINLLADELSAFYESSEGKGAEYLIPMELLSIGQLIAVPMRSRQTTTTRRVFRADDQVGSDPLERRWTRAIITHPYNAEDRTFIAHLIDMGCAMRFREARFLLRDRFLHPDHGFDKGFAVQIGLMGVIPPIGLYVQKMLENPASIKDIPVAEVPAHLSRKGFPASSVEYIRFNYSTRKCLTACFFKSKRQGLKYEALIADVSTDDDDFLTESLSQRGCAEQLPVPDALSLLQGQVSVEDMLKRRIMVELKKGV